LTPRSYTAKYFHRHRTSSNVRYTIRLYKKKDIPKPHHSTLDCPPGLPSASPGSTTPDRFKRAAEAVSKQISEHKAIEHDLRTHVSIILIGLTVYTSCMVNERHRCCSRCGVVGHDSSSCDINKAERAEPQEARTFTNFMANRGAHT
jgi:hypothetical protein